MGGKFSETPLMLQPGGIQAGPDVGAAIMVVDKFAPQIASALVR